MEHTEWLAEISHRASEREVGRQSGVPFRTINSQMKRGRISAEVVIRIAEGYGKSPVRALVDTGYLDEQWAETVDQITALRQVSEEDLADEVLRRMKLPGAHEVFDTPVDELDARRSAKSNGQVPPRPADEDNDTPLGAVAYSGEDEDAQRQKEDSDFD